VAEKALDIINTPEVLSGVATRNAIFSEELNKLNERFGIFKEVRGSGLLVGAELIEAWHGKAADFMAAAREQGLLLLVAGPNVLRFAPSLIIPESDIREGMAKLGEAIAKVLEAAKA